MAMASCLEGLEPKRVLEIFSDLCQIPHGSKNEKAISDYIYNFAKNLNLECYQDQANNLIIKKPASPGYENAPTVILQAHMDMVCEKNADVVHDFKKDPIHILRDGDRIHADGTTLGADDATGVAFAMCVLEDESIVHPNLEVILTTDEEAPFWTLTFAAKFSCVTKKFEEFPVTYKGTFLFAKFTVSESIRKYNTMQQSVRKRKRNVIGMP